MGIHFAKLQKFSKIHSILSGSLGTSARLWYDFGTAVRYGTEVAVGGGHDTLFLAEPAPTLGLPRIPDKKCSDRQGHQNNPYYLTGSEFDAATKGMDHRRNYAN